jgi:hypothetical protein
MTDIPEDGWISKFDDGLAARDLMKRAEERYLQDAEFKAVVDTTINAFRLAVKMETGDEPLPEYTDVMVVSSSLTILILELMTAEESEPKITVFGKGPWEPLDGEA